MCCCNAVSEIWKQPFWKREKVWETQYKNDIMPIVNATNKKIEEYLEKEK